MDLQSLQQKLQFDRDIKEKQKQHEENILNELTNSKEILVHNTLISKLHNNHNQSIEKYENLLLEQKQHFENILARKEHEIAAKDVEIANLRQKLESESNFDQRLHKIGKDNLSKLREQENVHLNAMDEMSKNHSRIVNDLRASLLRDKQDIILTCESKNAAYKKSMELKFRRKVQKFEELVKSAMGVYKEKQLILEGSFLAARNEIDMLSKRFKETVYIHMIKHASFCIRLCHY